MEKAKFFMITSHFGGSRNKFSRKVTICVTTLIPGWLDLLASQHFGGSRYSWMVSYYSFLGWGSDHRIGLSGPSFYSPACVAGVYLINLVIRKVHMPPVCGAGPFLTGSGYFFHRFRLPAPAPIKGTVPVPRLSTIKIFFNNIPSS